MSRRATNRFGTSAAGDNMHQLHRPTIERPFGAITRRCSSCGTQRGTAGGQIRRRFRNGVAFMEFTCSRCVE